MAEYFIPVLNVPGGGAGAAPASTSVLGSNASGQLVKAQGLRAQDYGVTGNGYFNFGATTYYFALTQVTVSGGSTTYTGTITGGAANAFVGYTFTATGFTNGGNNVNFTVTASTATTLVCTTSTQTNETHAGNAGSNVIDCATANFNTQATVGQIVFVTNLTANGFSKVTIATVPQGTISSINSNTRITVSQYATGGGTLLVWGDDQSTALTNAWNAITSSVSGGMLALPTENPKGDGPAVILVQSAQLNTSVTAQAGTGGIRAGYGAYGGGIAATFIVPTPNFNFSTTTANGTCFLEVADGGEFHDFTITGMGVSNPGSGLGSKIGCRLTTANNANWHDLAFTAWGANSSNGIGTGYAVNGGEAVLRRIDCDMFGQTGCQCSNNSHIGYQVFDQCTFWDNANGNLLILGTNNNPVFTFGCNFGNGGYLVSVNGATSAEWHDFGSNIGFPTVSSNNGILVGYTTSGGGKGNIYLTGTKCDTQLGSGGHVLYLDNANCTAVLNGCFLKDESSQKCITNNGTITDGAGNSFSSAASVYNGTGTILRNTPKTNVVATALAANYNGGAAATLVTPVTGGSVYRICAIECIVQAATNSCTMPSLTIGWTDRAGVARTNILLATNSTNSTATLESSQLEISTDGSTAITATSAGYASSGATAMNYDLYISVEQLV